MSHVIPRLLAQGHDVIGLDNGQKWGQAEKKRNYSFEWADCSSPDIYRCFLGADAVIQAAGTLYGVVGFHKHGAEILSNDLAVQRNVLNLARWAKVERFVYISSSMVYETSSHCREDEDTGLPATDYGLSKLVGERLVKAYAKQYGLEYTIWRPFNALDPEEKAGDEPGISHVVPDLMDKLIRRDQPRLELLGDGQQVRCFCHIKEIAEGIADYSFDQRSTNQTFNIGRNEPVTILQLAEMLHAEVSHCLLEFTFTPAPSTDVRSRIGDFTKIKNIVGWESQVSLKQMIKECVLEYDLCPAAN